MFGQIFSKDLNKNIEFIPYNSTYYDQTIEVIRKAFFKYETVSVGSEIDQNVEAQRDLEGLCDDALKKSDVSIIARDVELDKIVGVAINVKQTKQVGSDEKSYFERISDECKTKSAKSLMNFMIAADAKVDLFEKFNVDSLFEIMFLAVLKEYGRQGIGYELCKYSIDNAKNNDLKLISSLFTGRNTHAIGRKLGFEVVFEESFNNYSFNGKTFAERCCDPELTYHLAAKSL
ncbi:unnamed protein product [Chironomus riparius]|uniref:N-acetyltransferase domain-containing protein n=1 Tax=Chironomus riparius TaxID=315576 RepID=A0A9N9RZG0_9DIPT|nr:unnamed protein product [Chironomus riparius]